MQSRFGTLTPVLGVLIIIAIGAAAYAAQASAEPSATEHAEYRNSQFGFSLSYPSDMTVTENNEAGGAQSITFASASTDSRFNK